METVRSSAFSIGIAGAIGAAGVLTGYAYAQWQRQNQNRPVYTRVGDVDQLWIYPIKSCKPIAVKEAEIGPLGFHHNGIRDRVFLITDEKYRFITARQENRLVLIQPSFHDKGELRLDAPGMDTISVKIPKNGTKQPCRIWGSDSYGLDCGKDVAAWIEKFLNRKPNTIRMLYHPWETTTRVPSVDNWERFTTKDSCIFSDLCPALLVCKSSLNDLNLKLSEDKKVSALNFRPNLVVTGTHPYDEDYWTRVKMGDECVFRCVRPCGRCILTTIDPETGVRGEEPLKTLKTYRQTIDPKHRKFEGEAPRFGQYLGPDRLGKIRVGDPLYVAY